MELKRAKEVLEAAGVTDFSKYILFSNDEFFCIHSTNGAKLDGKFTSDQLEAIATWMRDPEGVVGA